MFSYGYKSPAMKACVATKILKHHFSSSKLMSELAGDGKTLNGDTASVGRCCSADGVCVELLLPPDAE